MYKYIIFDVDGTLIDTEKAVLGSLHKLLKDETGRDYLLEDLVFALGIPGKVALQKLGIPNAETVDLKWDAYMNEFNDQMSVFDKISDVLELLKKYHISLGVVTSKTRLELHNSLTKFDLLDYFSYIVCADDTVKHKPDPEPLYKFLELSGIHASECLYVGDTVYDMTCAKQADIDFALAAWGARSTEQIESDYILNSPMDLKIVLGVI